MDQLELWDDDRLLRDRTRPGATFATFYRRHVTSVLAFYAHRGVDVVRAGELTAATFAAALEERHGYRYAGSSTVSWLHAIASCKLAFGRAVQGDAHSGVPGAIPVPITQRDRADYAQLAGSRFDVLDALAYGPRLRPSLREVRYA